MSDFIHYNRFHAAAARLDFRSESLIIQGTYLLPQGMENLLIDAML
jgi:hypothetical protein